MPVRSIDNQAELMRHRARELLAGRRRARMAADGFNENGEIVVLDCAPTGEFACVLDVEDVVAEAATGWTPRTCCNPWTLVQGHNR